MKFVRPMTSFLPTIRNAVRALILQNGQVLMQHKVYEDGQEKFTLPGGAPNVGETLHEGLRRECAEEIGSDITIKELMHVADFYKERETLPVTHRHQVEFIFRCHVPATYIAQNGPHPDKHQRDVVWISLDELQNKPLFPKGLSDILSKDFSPTYLGLIP